MSGPRRAQALQGDLPMPRKQRFKPSRKPQPIPGTVASPQVDDRKDIQNEPEIGRGTPSSDAIRDIEPDKR
ncbi:MAG: hypothetical protein HOV81_40955 [Kofleriaceae bacterium]|nr:hypothetical protein [Kofleriaceae bacterium]